MQPDHDHQPSDRKYAKKLIKIAKHRANVNVYLEHPAGIGEHSDITEAIQVELDKIARYHDQVTVIDQYFKVPNERG